MGAPLAAGIFFCGEDDHPYPWSQGGGINAGVILLQPGEDTLARMIAEVTCETHPEHIKGNGPEQDYLTRFFAWAPWHSIDVRWNFQLHHIPFALESVLEWYRNLLDRQDELEEPEREQSWLPPRLSIDLETIGIVHLSGDVKPWHLILDAVQNRDQSRAVQHATSFWKDKLEEFGEYLMANCCESHERWVTKSASVADYAAFGVELSGDGRFNLVGKSIDLADAGDAPASDNAGAGCMRGQQDQRRDVTELVESTVDRLRRATRMALHHWQRSANEFLEAAPGVIEEFQHAVAPEGCFAPGMDVEVLWPPDAPVEDAAAWQPATVVSVHSDGHHVVRFQRGGSWGDTERGVKRERLRGFDQSDNV